MRVVTWNVQHGVPDPIGPPDLLRSVEPLRALDADVVALQELDRRRWRTRFDHQGAQLADALGGQLLWAPAKRRHLGWQANALVVRGELVARQVLVLPGSGERRVAALAQVVAGGARWSVACTHLSLDRADARHQLRVVLDALSDRPAPRVLLGDLNLLPDHVRPEARRAGYELVPGPPTHNARRGPDRRLDHVLVDGATTAASGVEKLPVSDHLAVWADLVAP